MIDLQPFCGTDETRPYLMKPFTFGEFTYATNGHIMVRVPRQHGVAKQTKEGKWNGPLEGIESAEFDKPPSYVLPPQPSEETVCEACDGRGYEHDCPDCECTCEACGGSGNQAAEMNVSTVVGGVNYALRYVRKVMALPDIELARPDPEKPLLFRFRDGVGAVMPMRGPAKVHVEIKPAA